MARSFGVFMLFHLSPTCTESEFPFKNPGDHFTLEISAVRTWDLCYKDDGVLDITT